MNLMNKETINLPRLINLIAEKASVNPATARRFLHDLFAYIEEQLAQGESVKIKGVGEFVRGDDASNPVLFKADEDLAALANEPFSAFSAVELHDEAVDEIKALDEKPEPIQEPTQSKVEIEDMYKAPEVTPPSAEETHHPIATEELLSEPEAIIEEKIEEVVEAPAALTEVVAGEGTNVSEPYETPTENAVTVEVQPQPKEALSREVQNATRPEPETTTEAKQQPEVTDVISVPEAKSEVYERREGHHSSHRHHRYVEEYERPAQSSHTMWLVLGILIGLILGLVGGYFAGKTMAAYELPAEDDYSLIDELEPDTVPLSVTEIMATSTDSAKQVATQAVAPATATPAAVEHTAASEPKPTPAPEKKAEPVYDTITSKRYLSILAKDHYGEKKYWIFIYNANPQLGNPNQISPGTKVLIPARESFEEATKAQTDAKAQRLLNQLAKKYKF